MRYGADSGGTFTDVVADDGRVEKVLSTPDDPGRAVRQGLAALAPPAAVAEAAGGGGLERPRLLAHGTTVATNALLERRGARVALVTNVGFADLLEIARQDRPSLYDPWADRPQPLVPRELRLEIGGRLDASGAELAPVPVSELGAEGGLPVPDRVDAIAVCLLHADLNPAHERAVAAALQAAGRRKAGETHEVVEVTCSTEVSPEFREYERMVTTVVNAFLRPVCRRYLRGLEPVADTVLTMTSAGGLIPAAEAAALPAALLLSGPAGGVRAAAAAAVAAGFPDAVTFDMGGTSTDVCLILGGVPEPAAQRTVAGFPVRLPSLDVHTIGAGGGSIAYLDRGGALRVGPHSAGAVPGPACYSRGGTSPTVTDADLALGRIPADAAFPGLGRLDLQAAQGALANADVTAAGVVTVVDAAMEQAVRAVSVERGVDARRLALVAFGGAGPLHACALAEVLGMPCVVVPPRAGVLSAVGLLCSPPQRDLVRSWPNHRDHRGLPAALDVLRQEARAAVTHGDDHRGEVEVETFVDCRYEGQSHELTVPDVDAFHGEHRRRNGFERPEAQVEVVAIRARARRAPPLDPSALPLPPGRGRRPATGPCVLAEPDCTVWVPAGWRAETTESGAWVLTRLGDRRSKGCAGK